MDMRRRLGRSLLVALAVGALIGIPAPIPASAAMVIDQDQGLADEMFCIQPTQDSACYSGAAQTLTVKRAGDLIALDLLLARASFTTKALTIEIRAGSPTGALIATSDPVPASAIPVGNHDGFISAAAWVLFELSQPVAVTTGQVIAIVVPPTPLFPTADPAWGWAKTSVDRYLPGRAWGGYSAAGIPAFAPYTNGSDFAFTTYIGIGPSPFVDTASSIYFWDIEWLYESGITTGCDVYWYCPTQRVKREQMASFLARALALPPTAVDAFTDDEMSMHEDNINRIAAAGIATGCGVGTFCPWAFVRRDQMASFLVRALDLPPTATDFFGDDDGNLHEDSINRLAAAGISTGCYPGMYCPSGYVTRGQMAAFLHRAFGG